MRKQLGGRLGLPLAAGFVKRHSAHAHARGRHQGEAEVAVPLAFPAVGRRTGTTPGMAPQRTNGTASVTNPWLRRSFTAPAGSPKTGP